MVFQQELCIDTNRHGQMTNIDADVRDIIRESGIEHGLVHIFNVGSTASVGTVEFEPGLVEDLPQILDHLIPPSLKYGHERAWHDGNGHSHLQATMMGPDLTVPVNGGSPMLGTWQQIFHIELDVKPRQRTIIVTVMG